VTAAIRSSTPRHLAALVAGVTSLAVYLTTFARSVGFIDRGELAAVAATLGIAHPTGYPLLTLLGHAAVRLAPGSPLIALNVLAALWVAAGVAVLVVLFDRVLALASPGARALDPRARALIAALAALATGFTATWWQQANGFEAYALQALLLPLVCWTFLRYLEPESDDGARASSSGGAAFAFTVGLAMSNHLTTTVLAPAMLTAFFVRRGFGMRALRSLLALAPPFVLGLTPYLYLVFRVAQSPRFSWGDPDTPWRFWTHVTGRQYQVWMFSDSKAASQQLEFIVGRLPWEWVGIGLLLAAAGVVGLWPRKGLLFAIGLVALASVGWACAYAIRDIDPYVMPLTLAVGMLVATGLAVIAARWGTRVATVAGVAGVVLALAFHWRSCDERDQQLVDDYVHNLFQELPERAVVVSTLWDHLVSPSYYLQEVEHLRPDVTVIDHELMRRSWYVRELGRRDSALMKGFASEAERFQREVQPFERALPYDPDRIQSAYLAMFVGIERSARDSGRRLFVTWDARLPVWQDLERIPRGLTAELTRDTSYVAFELPQYRYRRWEGRRDHYVATLARNYGESLAERAAYEARHGRMADARRVAAHAAQFAPSFGMREVPPLPLDGRELVLASLELFRRLEVLGGRPLPGGSPVERRNP
jgi:Protein of unknown function (DUF2723)